jgi:flagellar basal-body rod modification protein FlgD
MEITGTPNTTSSLYGKTVGKQDLGKNDFLNLLVTQLKNQDPLQPMDNTAFVAQLAQFSNVEQLVAVNEGINILGMQQLSSSNAQASSLIGKSAEVKSDSFTVYANDTEAKGALTLGGEAEKVEVQIRDASGSVVKTLSLGRQPQGEVDYTWDLRDENGVKMPPGKYRINVTATDAEGNDVSCETKIRGNITGVSYKSGYAEVMIGDVTAQLSDIVTVYPATDVGP